MSGEDGDDDYMSDSLLAGMETIKPGLARTTTQRRIMKIEAERHEAEQERRRLASRKPTIHVERERREEALARPVGEESKGFALMAKMGFKPGMSLGKKKDENDLGSGIKEPVSIVVRGHRGGLGAEAEEERKEREAEAASRKRIQAQMDRMKERARMTDDLMDDYKKRKRVGSSRKQLIGDLVRSKKTCHELDMRNKRELPERPWFWPSYRDKSEPESIPGSSSRVGRYFSDDIADPTERFVYSNGAEAPTDDKIEDISEEELTSRLEQITRYLREHHFYCVWCGCAYSDAAELAEQCPGNCRHLHDEDEEDE